ncbi:hypothetical protein CARUB_v10007777mg [Capsella rubella]|uniref:Uncharacterized protein n=1 Tax=Capsella rubella TaxID=81985 RepID=R0GQF0_9BRAS|nr:uncharacterized protein LOC17880674 [Capsella rubella]EOA19109.1 hypothetical protein CARUB_v10007777mg [Capsella rubella]
MINLEKKAETKEVSIRNVHDKTDLLVDIFEAFVIDDRDVLKPHYGPNYYFIKVWINEAEQYGTSVVKGFKGRSIIVNQGIQIPLESSSKYLYVEVLKGCSFRDPGTSNGTVVMGRARITLPPPFSHGWITGVFDLVGFKSGGGVDSDLCLVKKGTIKIAMKLRHMRNHREIVPSG